MNEGWAASSFGNVSACGQSCVKWQGGLALAADVSHQSELQAQEPEVKTRLKTTSAMW